MTIPSKIFIVPYRNRKYQKTHFMVYMKYLLEDISSTDYEIVFSHQCDNRPFNRGAIKNIGFLAMKNKYPNDYKDITFIFNDIDTIPTDKNILNYDTTSGIVKHFYGFEFALGGIFSIKGADFEKCNGFPGFWGWGMEDNTMHDRVLRNNIKIDRNTFYTIGSEEILQQLDKPYRFIANKDASRYKNITNDGLNTIHDLNYKIENEYINVFKFNNSINPNDEKFYYQNIAEVTKVMPNLVDRIEKQQRWRMQNFMKP